MQLTIDPNRSINTIRSYESGQVPARIRIGDEYHQCPLILTATDRKDWTSFRADQLEITHFETVLEFDPEIVVLGCGEMRLQPMAALIAALASRGIGLEAMDNGAACRTYNVLVAEDRRVVLALQD